ncbi:MAG: hypothetical protein WCJ61_06850 [Paludibacter sp.]
MNANYDSSRFENEFLKKMRESDVWKKLSRSEDLIWSEGLIDKYADQWNWEELCENGRIPWTESLIEKYKNRIHWANLTSTIFCRYSRRYLFGGVEANSKVDASSLLRKFSDFWNWENISSRAELNFTPELIETFANKWVWKELIDNRDLKWNYQLFERFRVYIPLLDIDNLKRSQLWEALVEMDFKIMTGKILVEN